MSDNPQDKQMAMISHLLGIITGFIGALIVWLIKKAEGGFVVQEAKKALNFQITLLIVWIILAVVIGVLAAISSTLGSIGAIVYLVVWVANIIFCVKAGLTANKGEPGAYPFSLNLIK